MKFAQVMDSHGHLMSIRKRMVETAMNQPCLGCGKPFHKRYIGHTGNRKQIRAAINKSEKFCGACRKSSICRNNTLSAHVTKNVLDRGFHFVTLKVVD